MPELSGDMQSQFQPLLDMLSEVCGEKAEHVRSNWQDDDLADQWIRFASFLDEKASEATEL